MFLGVDAGIRQPPHAVARPRPAASSGRRARTEEREDAQVSAVTRINAPHRLSRILTATIRLRPRSARRPTTRSTLTHTIRRFVIALLVERFSHHRDRSL